MPSLILRNQEAGFKITFCDSVQHSTSCLTSVLPSVKRGKYLFQMVDVKLASDGKGIAWIYMKPCWGLIQMPAVEPSSLSDSYSINWLYDYILCIYNMCICVCICVYVIIVCHYTYTYKMCMHNYMYIHTHIYVKIYLTYVLYSILGCLLRLDLQHHKFLDCINSLRLLNPSSYSFSQAPPFCFTCPATVHPIERS